MSVKSLGRLTPSDGQPTMKAIVTIGNGGYDHLVYCDVARPAPGPTEVLVQVRAAGMNNTEINTRLGWYSSSVKKGTQDAAEAEQVAPTQKADGGWHAETPFPFIQGTDRCRNPANRLHLRMVQDTATPGGLGRSSRDRRCTLKRASGAC